MPSILLPLISYQEFIDEPIRKQLTTLVGGDINYINTAGNKLTRSTGIDLINADDAKVVISENPVHESGMANNVTGHNIRHTIIEDDSIGFVVKLADVEKRYLTTVTKRFTTRADAIWWINRMAVDIREGVNNKSTNIMISPCIPNTIINLLEHLRKLKERRGEEDRDFMNYLLWCSIDTLSMDTNSTNSTVAITFPEVVIDAVVSFPSEIPTPTLEDGKYIIDFEFTTILKVPVSVTVKYPYFVGGIPLPKELIDTTVDVNSDPQLATDGGALNSLLGFDTNYNSDIRNYCYQLPAYESYTLDLKLLRLSPIFQIRIAASMEKPRLIANLNDLFNGTIGGFILDPEILRYIVEFKDGVTYIGKSAVNVILYKNNIMVTNSRMYIDDHLCLMCKDELDMLGDYHLLITTGYQTAEMPLVIFETLSNYPLLINKLIKHTNPLLPYESLPDSPVVTVPIYKPLFNSILRLSNAPIGPVCANVLILNTKWA